nr:acyl carrier protein [Cytophagales bacterium]
MGVFRLYGISLLGRRKFDNLYEDLNMDQIFVLGLIYELEHSLECEMEDKDAYAATYPAYIIEKLLG